MPRRLRSGGIRRPRMVIGEDRRVEFDPPTPRQTVDVAVDPNCHRPPETPWIHSSEHRLHSNCRPPEHLLPGSSRRPCRPYRFRSRDLHRSWPGRLWTLRSERRRSPQTVHPRQAASEFFIGDDIVIGCALCGSRHFRLSLGEYVKGSARGIKGTVERSARVGAGKTAAAVGRNRDRPQRPDVDARVIEPRRPTAKCLRIDLHHPPHPDAGPVRHPSRRSGAAAAARWAADDQPVVRGQRELGTGSRISCRASGAAARSASAEASSGRAWDRISASTRAV